MRVVWQLACDGAGELEGALGQDAVSAEHESPERHGAADAPPERLAILIRASIYDKHAPATKFTKRMRSYY